MKTRNLLPAACLALVLCEPSHLDAASLVYDAGTGNWNTAANWSGPDPRRVPLPEDTAFIRLNRIVTVDAPSGTVGTIYLGAANASGSVIFNAGGALSVTNSFEVMRQGAFTGIGGNLTMSGGTLSVGGTLFVGVGGASTLGSSSGTATFSGGSFSGAVSVGATVANSSPGYFNVVGSLATIGGSSFTVNQLGQVSFAFGTSGVTMLNYATGTAGFASGSKFLVDGSLYTGPGGDFTLVDSETLAWGVQPGDLTISGFGGYTTQLLTANNDVVLRLTVVPEPGAFALLLAATPLLGFRARRRSRSSR